MVGRGVIDIAAPQFEFAQAGQQPLDLLPFARFQDFGEFRCQPVLNGKAAANGAFPVRRRGQSGDPVIVEITDIFVGKIVNRLLQVTLNPWVLGLGHGGQNCVFD